MSQIVLTLDVLLLVACVFGVAGAFILGWVLRRQADADTMASAQAILAVGRTEAEIGSSISELAAGLAAMNRTQEAVRQKMIAVDSTVNTVYHALAAMGALDTVPRMERNAGRRPRATGEPPLNAPPILERGAEPDESLL